MKEDKQKQIDGLNLMDYKNIEHEATEQLVSGRKICVIAGLMLANAKENIKELGGKTMEEEDAEQQKQTKENLKNTTG